MTSISQIVLELSECFCFQWKLISWQNMYGLKANLGCVFATLRSSGPNPDSISLMQGLFGSQRNTPELES